jgi:hypothetical protein
MYTPLCFGWGEVNNIKSFIARTTGISDEPLSGAVNCLNVYNNWITGAAVLAEFLAVSYTCIIIQDIRSINATVYYLLTLWLYIFIRDISPIKS